MKTSRRVMFLIVSAVIAGSQLPGQQVSRQGNVPPLQRPSYSNAEFADAQELQRRESSIDAQGKFTRIRLVKTDLKYPFVRVESTVARNAVTRAEAALSAVSVVANQALVLFRQEVDRGQAEQLASDVGAKVRKKLLGQNAYLLEKAEFDLDTLPELMQAIAARKDIVMSVEPNGIGCAALTPNDARFGEQWSLNNLGGTGKTTDADIDAPEAWDINTGASSVIVAVIDTGVDFGHPDLSGASSGNGWDFVNNDNDPTDDYFHGTHVAGILGARGNNGIGIAGVAWNCRIMALKVLDSTGHGSVDDLNDALDYARTHGAQIINMSLQDYPQSALVSATLDALQTAGVLVVCAAGNHGSDNDVSPNYPSSYPQLNIISVASSTDDDELASYSNFGLNSVDVAAPDRASLAQCRSFMLTSTKRRTGHQWRRRTWLGSLRC